MSNGSSRMLLLFGSRLWAGIRCLLTHNVSSNATVVLDGMAGATMTRRDKLSLYLCSECNLSSVFVIVAIMYPLSNGPTYTLPLYIRLSLFLPVCPVVEVLWCLVLACSA